MKLHLLERRNAGGYVSFGTCWNKGEVTGANFALLGAKGEAIPMQSEAAAFWPDGSVKWARHTANSERMGGEVEVVRGKAGEPVARIRIAERDGAFEIDAGRITLAIPRAGGDALAENVRLCGAPRMAKIRPVFRLERREESENEAISRVISCESQIDAVTIETAGPVACVVKYSGTYWAKMQLMPFVIRMTVGLDCDELKFQHTFFYNGSEKRDFLKGMGICFETALTGDAYNRHVKFAMDYGVFHETPILMESRIPRTGTEMKAAQMAGESLHFPEGSEEARLAAVVAGDLPVWNRYVLVQQSATSYLLSKQTKRECCLLDVRAGYRAPGGMAISGEDGGALFGLRDFWQRYPSGLEADGLSSEAANCTIWFYSPEASAMDFRHYDTHSYPQSSYEGFVEYGASADGIATTSECAVKLINGYPSDACFQAFVDRVRKPAVYVATPEEYHKRRAFGYWSLPCEETEMEREIETQLNRAIYFYKTQVEQRNWYGLFNYGDFCHSYDAIRHTWKYDVGGYAWQNTELVPTYWLWLYFMRTGREDVFTLAEAMSRHCSETDVYHFGPIKGVGSRHNVRHWGCSCKEPRVAMAGHHRPLYYLTGDLRIGDYFDEVKDAAMSQKNVFRSYGESGGKPLLCARTGPDWAAFVSNWATQYERTLDEAYLRKIEAGIEGIKRAPLKLASGPAFGFEPETGKMEYIGEFMLNIHLTLCMGGPQVWLEVADAIESDDLRALVADYGKIYMMTDEERHAATSGLTDGKAFAMPYVAAAIAAFGAARNRDAELARRAWEAILLSSPRRHGESGFAGQAYAVTEAGVALEEIPWLSTNYASQWCLSAIMVLEFAREALPSSEEAERIIASSLPKWGG